MYLLPVLKDRSLSVITVFEWWALQMLIWRICDCPGHWYGDVCEYTEINRTEVCIDTFETLGRLYNLFVTHLSSFVASK